MRPERDERGGEPEIERVAGRAAAMSAIGGVGRGDEAEAVTVPEPGVDASGGVVYESLLSVTPLSLFAPRLRLFIRSHSSAAPSTFVDDFLPLAFPCEGMRVVDPLPELGSKGGSDRRARWAEINAPGGRRTYTSGGRSTTFQSMAAAPPDVSHIRSFSDVAFFFFFCRMVPASVSSVLGPAALLPVVPPLPLPLPLVPVLVEKVLCARETGMRGRGVASADDGAETVTLSWVRGP